MVELIDSERRNATQRLLITMAQPTLEIVVGIIRSKMGKVFITRRKLGTHLAGWWEFPGGKIEGHENARAALARELFEEVGIHICRADFLQKICHDYPDRKVILNVYLVEEWEGMPFGKEGQEGIWISPVQLNAKDFPLANLPVIETLQKWKKMPK